MDVMIGTAGWSIPAASAADFPDEGSHLERYARHLPAVEINSSFHRPHRPDTYRRWAAAVPEAFRFAVKLPKAITHQRRLVDAGDLLQEFAAQIAGLAEKLEIILVQLPPSLAFDSAVGKAFFPVLGQQIDATIACEPRHPSWFTDEADDCLAQHRVARVAADPLIAPAGARPGGWPGLRYHRLHGAPRIYYSPYDEAALAVLAEQVAEADTRCWCMFDNTASGAATGDALALQRLIDGRGVRSDAMAGRERPR